MKKFLHNTIEIFNSLNEDEYTADDIIDII